MRKIITNLFYALYSFCIINIAVNVTTYINSGLYAHAALGFAISIAGIWLIAYWFKDTIRNNDTAKEIKIMYYTDIDKIKKIAIGDWIDLRAAEDIELKKGEFKLISLGVSMKLPKGYEAHIVPRSSTFKNFRVIQSNGIGIVDSSYCGSKDIWKFPALAMEDTVIHKNDRICQFRIIKNQPTIRFTEVNELDDKSRGGFGTTGV
jgi:dUTP pyrophosphatase